jgi:mannose-1-phosphate guanylyltransferase
MNLMLLAAGEGTRLRPYTLTLPKPAIPFLGVPLAGHSLSFTDSMNIQHLVVNTFHLPQKIHHLFESLPLKADTLSFSDEVGQILDTGGGLGKAKAHFVGRGDFFLMNADEVILPSTTDAVQKAVDLHRNNKALATLFVMDHPGVGTEFGGVWVNDQNQVLGFGKQPIANASKALHFIGAQILSDRVFDFVPEGPSGIFSKVLKDAIEQNQVVQVFPLSCTWFETGNIGSFLSATKTCLDFLAGSQLTYQKLSLERALSTYSRTPFRLHKSDGAIVLQAESAKIDPSAKIKGFLVAGPHSVVGPHADLENVVINEKAVVIDGSQIKDQIVL